MIQRTRNDLVVLTLESDISDIIWVDAGFTINLDPKITPNHIGVKKWSGNFEAFSNHITTDNK